MTTTKMMQYDAKTENIFLLAHGRRFFMLLSWCFFSLRSSSPPLVRILHFVPLVPERAPPIMETKKTKQGSERCGHRQREKSNIQSKQQQLNICTEPTIYRKSVRSSFGASASNVLIQLVLCSQFTLTHSHTATRSHSAMVHIIIYLVAWNGAEVGCMHRSIRCERDHYGFTDRSLGHRLATILCI